MDPQGWLDGKNLATSRDTEHEKVANCNISAISPPSAWPDLPVFPKNPNAGKLFPRRKQWNLVIRSVPLEILHRELFVSARRLPIAPVETDRKRDRREHGDEP